MNDYTLSAVIRTAYESDGMDAFRADLQSAGEGTGQLASAAKTLSSSGISTSLTGPSARDFAKQLSGVQGSLLSSADAAKLWGQTLESTADNASDSATKSVHAFFNSSSKDFLNLGELTKGVFQSIEDAFFETLEKMIAKAAVYGMLNLLSGGSFGSVSGGFGKFLSFDEGGLVPGAAGAAVPAIVHAGEYVLNRQQVAAMGSSGSGGGTQISVTVNAPVTITGGSGASAAADARAIAAAITDAAKRGVSWAVENAKVSYKVGKAHEAEGAL